MGKSNNTNNKLKEVYQRDKNLDNFLEKHNIQILEDVNKIFINQIKNNFFDWTKENIKLVSCTMKITSDYRNTENIRNFVYSNLIEILPCKNESLIILSSNFLSVITNMLFGGHRKFIGQITNNKEMTSTEYFINKKIIKLIIESYTNACKKFFLIEMNFINVKILIDFKKINFDNSTLLLIKNFHFIFNNIEIFFSIFFSLSTIKKLNAITFISSNQNIDVKNTDLMKILFDDISYVKLEIITKWIDIFISYNQIYNLSAGDVLLIEKPDKTTSYIEKKAIFYGNYRTFNQRSIILIKEFIDCNCESQKKIRNALMSSIEKNDNGKESIDPEKKHSKHNCINKQSIPIDNSKKTLNNVDTLLNNKKIVLDTPVNITVELGRSKIKIKDFLNFSKGSVLMLDKLTEEPLNIFMNDSLIASGEIVVLENKYGLRITSIKKSLKSTNVSI